MGKAFPIQNGESNSDKNGAKHSRIKIRRNWSEGGVYPRELSGMRCVGGGKRGDGRAAAAVGGPPGRSAFLLRGCARGRPHTETPCARKCTISDRAHGCKERSAHADEGLSGERGHATFPTRGAPPRTDACVKSIARKMLSTKVYFIHISYIPKDNLV